MAARDFGEAEDARGVAKLIEHAAVKRFEATLLGGCEVIWEREGREVSEDSAHGLQTSLDLGGTRRGGGRAGLGMQATERVTKELATVGGISGLIGLDDDQGVARLEAVPLDAGKDSVLVLMAELAESARQRGSEGARTQFVPGRLGQTRAQRDAAVNPVGLVAEQARDRTLGEAVVGDERADDAGLVERSQRPRRSVGREQEPLVLRNLPRLLHDDGHEAMALLAPALEASESVEDLMGAVGGGDHAQRKIGELGDASLAVARPQ